MDIDFAKKFLPALHLLGAYHKHHVVGLHHIPESGPAIIATNHSLATYDISLLMAAIYDAYDRIPRSLIDKAFYRFEKLGEFMERTGGIKGTRENAKQLLQEGNLVFVAPGGMKESLRPSDERYQIRWDGRKGFVRLAVEAQVPIILAACPKADDIYDVIPNPITDFVYQNFRLPLFLAKGLGFLPYPIPKPAKLTHFISEPLHPPALSNSKAGMTRRVNVFHKKIVERMHDLMAEAVRYRRSD